MRVTSKERLLHLQMAIFIRPIRPDASIVVVLLDNLVGKTLLGESSTGQDSAHASTDDHDVNVWHWTASMSVELITRHEAS